MLTGVRPSPNIWNDPAAYEIENHAVDRAGLLARTMRSLADWSGRDVLDIGCGTGFHLPLFADSARSVVGVEPNADLAALAVRRTRRLPNVRVERASAESLPLPDRSVDVAHARWAYFFGPGSEPGLAELDRVMRRGGTAFVIDNDPARSTFGGWFRRGFPKVTSVESFWSTHGWDRHPLLIDWRFDSRPDFEAVVRIEFPPAVAEQIIEDHPGLTVDYAVNLFVKTY